MQDFFRTSTTECDVYHDRGQAPDKSFHLAETTEENVSAQEQVLKTSSVGKTENISAFTAETCDPCLLVNVSVNLATVQRWGKEIDPLMSGFVMTQLMEMSSGYSVLFALNTRNVFNVCVITTYHLFKAMLGLP